MRRGGLKRSLRFLKRMTLDEKLLKQCLQKDRKAQHFLYKHCYSLLMSICSRYTVNEEDARSLMNMGFLKILQHLDRYSKEVPFQAWIRKIMINTIIDEYRRNKNHKETISYSALEEEYEHKHFVDYNDAEKNLQNEELQAMILKLPEVSREVFNLYVVDGYNHREIGDMLNIAEGTSKWHLSHARQRIRQLLTEALNYTKMFIL